MNLYKTKVCFWCEEGLKAPDCEMVKSLGDSHSDNIDKNGNLYDTFLATEEVKHRNWGKRALQITI